jgi:hypothetical protein
MATKKEVRCSVPIQPAEPDGIGQASWESRCARMSNKQRREGLRASAGASFFTLPHLVDCNS